MVIPRQSKSLVLPKKGFNKNYKKYRKKMFIISASEGP